MFKFLKDTHKLSWCAILSALAFILSLVEIPTPFQAYLSIDFSEIPILIGAYSLGSGGLIIIVILRSVLRFALKGTLIMGEVAAVLASIICGLSFIYLRHFKKGPKSLLAVYLPVYGLSIALMITVFILRPSWWLYAFFLILGILIFILIINLIPKFGQSEIKDFLVESVIVIYIVTVLMTILNFIFITPSNFLGKLATYQTVLDMGVSLNDYLITYILPLLPFNILKYTIIFIVFYLIRRILTFFDKKKEAS